MEKSSAVVIPMEMVEWLVGSGKVAVFSVKRLFNLSKFVQ